MGRHKLPSILNSDYIRFFSNGSPHPAGSLLNAGIGLAKNPVRWWDTRPLSKGHPYYGLVMVLKNCSGFYRNKMGFQCDIEYGHFIITFPFLDQRYTPRVGQRWSELYVGFSGDIFDIAAKRKIITPESPVYQIPSPYLYIEKLKQLLQEEAPTNLQQDFARAAHFLGFLTEIIDIANPVANSYENSDWFSLACHAITADFSEKPKWDEIASSLGMSYNTFRNYFRKRAGTSPYQYREKRRFEMAKYLLKNDLDASCEAIAFVLGFSGSEHFSRQFKKRYCISPLQYRRQHTER